MEQEDLRPRARSQRRRTELRFQAWPREEDITDKELQAVLVDTAAVAEEVEALRPRAGQGSKASRSLAHLSQASDSL